MCFILPKFCLLVFPSLYLYSEITSFYIKYFVWPYFVNICITSCCVYTYTFLITRKRDTYIFPMPIAMQWHSASFQEAPLALMRLSTVITLPWWIIWSTPRAYSAYHIEARKLNIAFISTFHQEGTDKCISKGECCLIHLIIDDIHKKSPPEYNVRPTVVRYSIFDIVYSITDNFNF